MQAIGMRAMARRIVRFTCDHKTRLYYTACVCLLVAAAGLRFYDLSEKPLRHDEAAAANISRGALSEVVSNTRSGNSSPILYPLALWAVQQVESTVSSVRVVPATASVLTVVVMLFLLPRLGVARGAAFLAALLATLSVEAIRHAQDVREYSIDALLAVLMIAGLLRYLRDGRKALLCVSLFLAPLLQYGLVLFGAAVMGAAMVLPSPPTLATPEWNSYSSRIRHWLKPRIALLWPAGCFLVGCAISYAVTLRYQWYLPDFAVDGYLSAYYYQGQFDAQSLFAFSIDGIWRLLTYHLPWVVAITALTAFAILLVTAFLRKFQGKFPDSAIAVLFSFCIIISVSAAVLGIYPLGGIRQGIYLGPVIFLAVGLAFHWTAGCLSSLTRCGWTMLPLLVITGGTALAGVSAMRQDSPYQTPENIKSVLAVLKERVRKEDMVYSGWGAVPLIRFYLMEEEKPANYHYGTSGWCVKSPNSCIREMADLAYWFDIANGRIWFVTYEYMSVLKSNMPGVSVKEVVSGGIPGLYLIEDTEALINRHATDVVKDLEAILTSKPSIRSPFDVYLDEDKLTYIKEPCAPADTQGMFFLHLIPADVADLPAARKQYGFDNLDFGFNDHDYGLRSAERCVAQRELPDYAITRILTGQHLVNEDGFATNIWEGEIRFDEPLIRSTFDVYLDEDKLTYIKEPCGAEDVQETFFLRVDPADASDLPEHRKQYGFDNLDFGFNHDGIRSAGQCIVRRKLPDYAITRILTGQYFVNEDGSYTHLWEGEIRFDE